MNRTHFTTRPHTKYFIVFLFLLTAFLVGITPAAAQDIQCTTLHPTTITGTPTQAIALEGIPTDWLNNTVFATIATPNTTERIPVYVELTETGMAEFIVPLHPDNYMGGGIAEVTIYNAEFGEYCDTIELTINPLTPAPADKTLSALDEAMEQVFTEHLAFFGYESAELANFHPEEDPFGFTIASAIAMLHSETAQEATHNGSITVDGETYEIPHGLADALAYTSGYTDAMFEFLDEFSVLPDLPLDQAGGQSYAHVQGMGLIPPLPHNISTPEELDWWMQARSVCAFGNTKWVQAPRSMVGGALAAASLLPGTQVVTARAMLQLTISQIIVDSCSNLLPHRIVAFDVEASPGTHNEDGPTTGRWSATMTAVGVPYTLNWPTALSALPAVGPLGKVISKYGGQVGRAVAQWQPLDSFSEYVLMEIWDIHSDSGPLTVEPINPAPIHIDPNRPGEHNFIEWEVITLEGNRPFTLNPRDPLEYQAHEVGVAQVWVRTKADAFQGEFAGGHAILRVREIMIEIGRPGFEEGPYFVEPGETIELEAIVFDAEDPSLEWSATSGEIEVLGELYIQYTAPTEPAYIMVQAESMSRQGLRASGTPTRRGWVEILVAGLHLTPSKACIPVGSSQQLRAVYNFGADADFDDLVVMEHGSAGHVSGDTFHATSPGTMTIEVWDRDFPEMSATAEFTVREACETFTAVSTGVVNFETKGQCLALFNQTAYFFDGMRYMEFRLPNAQLDALLDGEVEELEFTTKMAGTLPTASPSTTINWSSDWLESGERATVKLTGEWQTESVLLDEVMLYPVEIFVLSGSISGPIGHIQATSEGLILAESFLEIDFVGLTDAWGTDDLFWGEFFDEFCFEALPFPWH